MYTILKKATALFLALLLIFAVGCKAEDTGKDNSQDKPSDTSAPSSGKLQLLYCENDTFNPYRTISKLNSELSLLLFDSLVKLDDNFEIHWSLAKSAKTEGNICTVTLKDALFSDSSTVTSDDVVYSYNLARQSAQYSHLLYEVASVSAADSKTVVFTLSKQDINFAKLLTFPILKANSDTLKNEDNVELPPIGSGRFVLNESHTGLQPNKNHFSGSSNITEISLINAPGNESMKHYVEVGATDIYYADSKDDGLIRMSGKKKSVNLNNLVYLGINHNYAPLKSNLLRYAISSAIDRSKLVSSAFYSNAVSATGFFHPNWKEVSGYQTILPGADLKISIENLENIGYNSLDKSGYRKSSSGNIVELSLLVNKDSPSKLTAASLIAEQLKAAGIKININAVDTASYYSALSSGSFQLYVGEVKLPANMDIGPLVLAGGSAAYGMVYGAPTGEFDIETSYISVVNGLYNGTNTFADAAAALLSSMPIIPLVYRSSLVFYSGDISDIGEVSASDIFFSVNDYKFNK